ncbi:MAG: hypothetical protein GTN36_03125 [Candidatus Aenigmarchaeota archaeon]|nr:hypothetical protein [Candidatus Aenigmarchaeota archaeon]
MNNSAYKFGEFLGKKLIEASELPKSEEEKILYPVSRGLIYARETLQRIPDEVERFLTLRDIKLGVDATIAAEAKPRGNQKIRGLYQRLLHILDLGEKA